jgi:glycosyltransferase involved in cell wall biosynthesis
MRIAIVITALAKQGSIYVFKELIHQLGKYENCEVNLFYFDDKVEIEVDCSVTRISLFGDLPDFNYDIVHSTGLRPDTYIFLHKKKFPSKTRFITTIHSYIRKDLQNEYNWIVSFMASKFWYRILNAQNLVAVLTADARDYYKKLLKPEITVVNNGKTIIQDNNVPVSDAELLNPLAARYKIIGAHAKITRIKGLETVINALIQLPEYAFVVVGKGRDLDELIELAEKNNVKDRCLFLGFRSNILPYFQYYNVYTMPSYSEGLPMALIEAVASRVPCLCSDINTFRELFDESQILTFKLGDSSDYAAQIVKLQSSILREQLIRNAESKYLKSYTGEIMGKRYISEYRRISEKKRDNAL